MRAIARFAGLERPPNGDCEAAALSLASFSCSSLSMQQRLYFFPLPQGQGSFRPAVENSGSRTRSERNRVRRFTDELYFPRMDLLAIQRSLRTRFDDFRLAAQRQNATAAEVALDDFERQFTRWTEAEEQALIPALERARIEGRDVRRELRLEYVQIRELTRFVLRQVRDGIRLDDLRGYVENLDRRLRSHESEKERVYYPAAELTDAERRTLESARPPD